MAITASLVKELREKTNVGMMECKKALTESGGDIDAAVKLLRERGAVKQAKKADREVTEGAVATKISADGKTGILFKLSCETDFVAINDNFKSLVDEVAEIFVNSDATDIESALAIPHPTGTVDSYIKAKVLELGENLVVSDFVRYSLSAEGLVTSYIHMGGKVGVLLEVTAGADVAGNADVAELVKDVCLHIAAAAPAGLSREDIPAELIEEEKAIAAKQLEAEGKPAALIEKILPGKLSKFYSEQCLLEQGFVKDPDTKVKDLVAKVAKAAGTELSIARFSRVAIG